MANFGRFVDRNADIRAAGVTTEFGDLVSVQDCMPFTHPADLAEQMMRQECRRSAAKPVGRRAPIIPSGGADRIFNVDLKNRFDVYRDNVYESLYSKNARLGSVKPTRSKPESVTNDSRTFGDVSITSEPLYPIMMPPKSAEQVNREYGEGHDQLIISHSHYLPSEMIKRKYTRSFDRRTTFGDYLGVDPDGVLVKRCLNQTDAPEVFLRKQHNDFIERQCGPLGKKYKYPYEVPDMIHGVTHPFECNVRMLFENTSSCVKDDRLLATLQYLIDWRRALYRRPHFHMYDLRTALKIIDKEHTGHLPLSKIIDTLVRLHVVVNPQKMRTALAYFHLIIDEGCATERVNCEEFCDLIGQRTPLPLPLDNSLPYPGKMYSIDTTYRLFCADRNKKPVEGKVEKKKVLTSEEQDAENTRAKDLIAPEPETLFGLGPSEFTCPRPKAQIERIFRNILTKDAIQTVWQQVMAEHKDPHEMVSIDQFRTVLCRIQDIALQNTHNDRS